ncbi:MAG: hypothetical protein KBG20_11400 [Caldilineaceae bacterium]|nr:hypothetical protein [Caldilineaceae bacterium]
MFNPIDYLLENISWYDPIYNIAWVMFMLYALTLPLLLLALFKLPALRPIQPTRTWVDHFHTYGYLLAAAFVIFSFRLIPYWIFNDKILHFLGGGLAIALIYEYFVLNFRLVDGTGVFSLKFAQERKATHLLANFVLLLMFASFFSVFSELYEFVSKYMAGYQFDSSGLDTWIDILANLGGAFLGYLLIWLLKYGRNPLNGRNPS